MPVLFRPKVYLVYHNKYHRYVRQHLNSSRSKKTNLGPVHLQHWEGIYFKHDMDTLKDLLESRKFRCPNVFVLDGMAGLSARNDDTAALGDWYVDQAILS